MGLSPKDYQFLRERRKQVGLWPRLGGVSLFALLAAYTWLSMVYPELANPVYVYHALVNDQLPQDLQRMLALLAPVMVSLIFILIGVMLGFGFAIMRREKQLLNLIDRLVAGRD